MHNLYMKGSGKLNFGLTSVWLSCKIQDEFALNEVLPFSAEQEAAVWNKRLIVIATRLQVAASYRRFLTLDSCFLF